MLGAHLFTVSDDMLRLSVVYLLGPTSFHMMHDLAGEDDWVGIDLQGTSGIEPAQKQSVRTWTQNGPCLVAQAIKGF